MSTTADQRQSPPSPWTQESKSLRLNDLSSPASLLSLRDTNLSPTKSGDGLQNAFLEQRSPSYFTIKVEDSRDRTVVREATNAKSHRHPSRNQNLHLSRNADLFDPEIVGGSVDLSQARPANDAGLHRISLSGDSKQKDPMATYDNTLSGNLAPTTINTMSCEQCAELLETCGNDVLLLDVRPYAHYARGHIKGSLNLCIPTTLLKRTSFDTRKLANTFTSDIDRRSFSRWKQCRYIIVYDAATLDMKDAVPMINMLNKFTAEGWNGEGSILRGGFKVFCNQFNALVQQPESSNPGISSNKPNSMQISLPPFAPIAGGCALPESSSAAIPFFGNIRQHMDLMGGVGQIPLQLPQNLTDSKRRLLPRWLRDASDVEDGGQKVSEKFLELEKKELDRMKQALSYEMTGVSTSAQAPSKKYRVAGIEKGNKNRYNNIYPFDHSRVRLQDVPSGGCDYVNANYMKAEYSNKRYIATQAPVPETFDDFWRVIWEQDVRIVVSLTAEIERGQVKCHRYWESGNYGPFRVNNFSERRIPMKASGSRQNQGQSTTSLSDSSEEPSEPCIIVRHFGLSHSAFPFQPLREVTQLQYPYWPDFGTTSQPSHLLQLVDECNAIIRATSNTCFDTRKAMPTEHRPVLVHCSAGCGRTGTFCTVDSVLDMLKRQHSARKTEPREISEWPDTGWIHNDNVDLIAKTVADFRTQRPSMIQNLSQFVLCYESVLEWMVVQMDEGCENP
ncbi:phosphotyrosine-specific ptp2-like protein [Aspergillus fumigatus]